MWKTNEKQTNTEEKKPTKSVCEKNETRKKGKENKVFWIKKEQEKSPEKITMFYNN
jgi:hypothetical protein